MLAHFVREEGGVDAAEDDERPSCMRQPPHVVAAKRICRVDADTDYVAAPYAVWVEWLERFVDDCRGAVSVGRGGGEDVQPSRRDDSRAEGHVARIDEMNAHAMVLRKSPRFVCRSG